MRYEDLYNDPKPTLNSLFAYVLGLNSTDGTVIASRIDEVVGSTGASILYPLKPDMSIYKAKPMYKDDEL